MWTDNRFVATRDPSRGGLRIIASAEGVGEPLKNEIYDDCLEIVAKNYECDCGGIYPLQNGQYAVMMARKVSGSYKESRMHEIIRGIIVKTEEMVWFCEEYIAEGRMAEFFFPEKVNPNCPDEWYPKMTVENHAENAMNAFWKCRDYKSIIVLLRTFQEIKKRGERIQLIVKDGMEWKALAVCSCMAVHAGVKLFVMANGECTLTLPDIVISEQLSYLEGHKYKKVDFEQLLGNGYLGGLATMDADAGESNALEETVEFCFNYLVYGKITDEELYEAVEYLKREDYRQFTRFRRYMKRELLHFQSGDCDTERYMTLLYMLFKKTVNAEMNDSMELCTAPYDFQGMYSFIKERARSKKELKKLLRVMLEFQFAENMGPVWKKAANGACRHILEKFDI